MGRKFDYWFVQPNKNPYVTDSGSVPSQMRGVDVTFRDPKNNSMSKETKKKLPKMEVKVINDKLAYLYYRGEGLSDSPARLEMFAKPETFKKIIHHINELLLEDGLHPPKEEMDAHMNLWKCTNDLVEALIGEGMKFDASKSPADTSPTQKAFNHIMGAMDQLVKATSPKEPEE